MKKIILIMMMVAGFAIIGKAQDTTKVKKTPEERAATITRVMKTKLNLTADQTTKINAILLDQAKQVDAMPKGRNSGMAKLKVMRNTDSRIEALLSDDQKKTYADMKANMKEKMKDRRAENNKF